MRRMLGLLMATALVGAASTAYADEITGPIKSIDRSANTFMVGNTLFAASPHNTVGAKLANLKPGDRVRVFYEANTSYRRPWNAMIIKKVG
jgi:hypothetical protein